MKGRLIAIGMLFVCLLAGIWSGCSDDGDDWEDNKTGTEAVGSIGADYWGTWIQMDTGDKYYIDSKSVYKVSSSSKKEIQNGISGYVLDASGLVLQNGSTVYFRKGGKKRGFTASFSGFASSARALGTGSQSISGRRKNTQNVADSETFTATTNGASIDFKDCVADDSQNITIDGSDTNVNVSPRYDGENVGTIPVVETGKYAFKTTYTVSNADSQGMMYGNLLGTYNVTFDFTNVGSATCSTSVYTISWDDADLKSDNLTVSGNFNSIEPGKSKQVTGTFYHYGSFSEEYRDVVINITIQDSGFMQTWYDSVVLRFYRGWVAMKVNARNFNEKSSAQLKGFLIYPDGRSQRFVVSAGSTSTVAVPWSTSDYYVVLSGATSETEMGYSFGTSVADLSGTWSVDELNAYEPNDSIATAPVVSLDEPVKAYLKVGDLDYYKVNVSSLPCSKGGIAYAEYKIGDNTSFSALNNGDGSINPGETIAMDVMVQNTSKIDLKYVGVTVSSTSQYVAFTSSNAEYGNITAEYYQTYCYKKNHNSGSGFSSSSDSYAYSDFNNYAPFKFTVSESCPVGTELPITVTMTDASGLEWTDTFTLKVVQTGTEMAYAGHKIGDGTSLGTLNNGDGSINPGETIAMDVMVQNAGTSLAQSITVAVSSTSQYVAFTSSSAEYGDITAKYYQTYCYKKYYSRVFSSSSDSYAYYNFNSYAPFKFTVDKNCPVGTELPITVTMTDARGRVWTDTFTLTVK